MFISGLKLWPKSGDLDGAKEKLRQLKAFVDEANSLQYTYWYASGALNIVEGNYKQACLDLEEAKSYNDEFVIIYMLAKAYYLAGQNEKAIAEFESIRNQYNARRSCFPVMSVKLYYYLGLAYEASGEYRKAAENYKKFLDIWKNADDGLRSVSDAEARLAKLTASSWNKHHFKYIRLPDHSGGLV